ncbi:DNA primase regulatory subunit PriL [Acidianus sulfidivorans JP7]|uniref:DNA primase large subunit PriL n=1 Tax=Acidianus sulfidivorans JP7 TaxID=619593 RepID=A0A2U9INN2_9CREN|nr:DNA primase regulatory subunit PriL [Acidianus sulfidivorans]AWR97615.1 DNA primase regulatory subunit PriL [Acidianus sulfidivorans JP7]
MGILTAIDYNKYPFMKNLNDVISKNVTIYDILSENSTPLKDAKERINKILNNDDGDLPEFKSYSYPYLVFYSELLILSILGDRKITNKILRKEARLFTEEIYKEPDEVFIAILNFLKINVEKSEISYHQKSRKISLCYRLHFIDYLKLTANIQDERVSLSKQIMNKGYVYVNKNILKLLIQEQIYEYINNLIKPISLSEIPDSIKDIILLRRKITPPCIDALMRKQNKNLDELKILTVYMLDIGSNEESISILLKNNGIEKPEDIINKLKGDKKTKYIVYSCDIMKKLNLCVSNCGVKNPLELYFGKLDITK